MGMVDTLFCDSSWLALVYPCLFRWYKISSIFCASVMTLSTDGHYDNAIIVNRLLRILHNKYRTRSSSVLSIEHEVERQTR